MRCQIRSKKEGASEYWTFCPSCHGNPNPDKRIEKDIWLGKPLDKENGIFYSKTGGIVGCTKERGPFTLSPEELKIYEKLLNNTSLPIKSYKNKSLSIDFGDIYVVNKYFENVGLLDLFKTVTSDISEYHTLMSLITYRMFFDKPNCYIYDWWNETYAKFIYPKAKLLSQQISTFLYKLGEEVYFRKYITDHINYIKGLTPKYCILIDSTGLPNDVDIPLTKVNNHNGVISNEIRLIFVVESNTGLPIYYRYVPGNIVDVSTLNMVINELKQYKIYINHAIVDAGYYSANNLLLLHRNKIPFVTRMTENLIDTKYLIAKYAPTIKNMENHISYNNRQLFIKKEKIKIINNRIDAYAYVCLDLARQHQEENSYISKKVSHISDDDHKVDMRTFGMFILLSTKHLRTDQILPFYYTRQGVEQIFDYLKNEIDILPIRVHSELAFAGHVLTSFMTLTGYISISNTLKNHKLSAKQAFDNLNRLHGRVYSKRIILDVANKSVNDICRILKVDLPDYLYNNIK
jgi:transposase